MSNIIVKKLTSGTETLQVDNDGPSLLIVYGSDPVDQTLTIEMVESNAHVTILGLFILSQGITTLRTVQHHAAPNSESNLHIKSILMGDASFKYHGMIRIEQAAQQSNAYQQNDNLILSPSVHIDTNPELEIIANDVKCSHGATIGRLDDMALYYMQSRGIDKSEARKLALNGFVQDIILKIPDEHVRCELNQFVLDKLQKISI